MISVIKLFPLLLVEVCCIIIQGNFHTHLFCFFVCVQFVPVATMRLNPAIFNICKLLFPYDEICVLVACSVVVDGRIDLTILWLENGLLSMQLIAPKSRGLDLNLLRNHGTDVCSLHQAHLGQGCSLRWWSKDFAHKVHMKTSHEGDVKPWNSTQIFLQSLSSRDHKLTTNSSPCSPQAFQWAQYNNTMWSYAKFLKNLLVIDISCAIVM